MDWFLLGEGKDPTDRIQPVGCILLFFLSLSQPAPPIRSNDARTPVSAWLACHHHQRRYSLTGQLTDAMRAMRRNDALRLFRECIELVDCSGAISSSTSTISYECRLIRGRHSPIRYAPSHFFITFFPAQRFRRVLEGQCCVHVFFLSLTHTLSSFLCIFSSFSVLSTLPFDIQINIRRTDSHVQHKLLIEILCPVPPFLFLTLSYFEVLKAFFYRNTFPENIGW